MYSWPTKLPVSKRAARAVSSFVCVPEADDELGVAAARRVVGHFVRVEFAGAVGAALHRFAAEHVEHRVRQQPLIHELNQRPARAEG